MSVGDSISGSFQAITKGQAWVRFRKFMWRLGYIAYGMPIGWVAAHYFVEAYGGEWPESTLIHWIADGLGYALGGGGLVALATAAINLWGKNGKGK